jgi:hypothetical protein
MGQDVGKEKKPQKLVTRICANPDCQRSFIGTVRAFFCSDACKMVMHRKRKAAEQGNVTL